MLSRNGCMLSQWRLVGDFHASVSMTPRLTVHRNMECMGCRLLQSIDFRRLSVYLSHGFNAQRRLNGTRFCLELRLLRPKEHCVGRGSRSPTARWRGGVKISLIVQRRNGWPEPEPAWEPRSHCIRGNGSPDFLTDSMRPLPNYFGQLLHCITDTESRDLLTSGLLLTEK